MRPARVKSAASARSRAADAAAYAEPADPPRAAEPRAANETYGGEVALTCRNVHWKRGDIVRLFAQPYRQVHVTLPENGIDVIMGDRELWALDWINNQVFIKPTSRSTEGLTTTITAIGQSGNAYEFVVHRVPETAEVSHCVYLDLDSGLVDKAAWAKAADNTLQPNSAAMRDLAANIDRQARDSLKMYRKRINSNYQWDHVDSSRWAPGAIDSVFDDGRFTYVRMKDDSQGLTSVIAQVDGKDQLLEYGYDSPSRTYQISGIFPQFSLRAGSQSLSITRRAD